MLSSSSSSTSLIASHTLTHSWTINNFTLYHEFSSSEKKFDNHFINTFCQSANFITEHLEFYLKLYPIIKRYDKKFVSLFLYNVNCTIKEVVVRFKLSVVNENGEKCATKWADWIIDVHSKRSRYGFDEFISYDELLDASNGLLPEGNLTIFAEITYITDQIQNLNESNTALILNQVDPQLTTDFEALFLSCKNSDITLIIADTKLKVHKAILASRSIFFADLFKENTDTFEIADMSIEVMEKILRFIYCGKADVDGVEEEVMAAAVKFNLINLKCICEDQLCSQLTADSASRYCDLAELYGALKLKALAEEYIHD